LLFVSLLQRFGFQSDPKSVTASPAPLQSQPKPQGRPVDKVTARPRSEDGAAPVRKRGITTDQSALTDLSGALRELARSNAPPTEQAPSGTERRLLVKAQATPQKKKPATSAGNKRTPPVVVSAKSTVKAPVKAASPVVSKSAKPVAKPAPKKAAPVKKPVAVPPTASLKKPAPVKTPLPIKKPVAGKAATAPASRTSAKPVAKTPAPKPAAKAVVAPVKSATKAAAPSRLVPPSLGKKPPAAAPKPAPVVVEPTPRPLGKRAAKKVMMEQMTQAAVVPTHSPNAAKATFSTSIERVMTPPVPSSVQKDTKRANNWKSLPVERLSDQDVLAMPDAEYMNDIQLAFFRRKLTLLKEDMLSNAGETTEHLREDTAVVPDPADRATIEEEHALELRTRDRERKLLKKIEQAIVRIDSGDYGYCEETGEAIGVGRLMARPTASLSLEAQQRRELKQKMFGD
jgi:DnaK suppressor protein